MSYVSRICKTSSHHSVKSRAGLTLVELFVVILALGILLAMLLPVTRRSSVASKRVTCMNQARQIALAIHNYESAYKYFPSALGPINDQVTHNGADRLSGLVTLLPFMEHNSEWDQILAPSTFDGVAFPAGPDAWDPNYPIWQTQISEFQCPASNNAASEFGQTNYAFCIGDRARNINSAAVVRGAFGGRQKMGFGQLTDGSSNTIGLMEIGGGSGRQLNTNFAINQPGILDKPSLCLKLIDTKASQKFATGVKLGLPRRGGRWADGTSGCAIANTILPPNSPSASIGSHASDGIFSAGGPHSNGVVICLMDGSGHFVSNEVDSGDLNQPTLSPEQMANKEPTPYGVWGQLGTANAGEEVSINDL